MRCARRLHDVANPAGLEAVLTCHGGPGLQQAAPSVLTCASPGAVDG